MPEIIGHALGGLSGYGDNLGGSIRVSNAYLKMSNSELYRNNHGGSTMSEEEATAISGYLR